MIFEGILTIFEIKAGNATRYTGTLKIRGKMQPVTHEFEKELLFGAKYNQYYKVLNF